MNTKKKIVIGVLGGLLVGYFVMRVVYNKRIDDAKNRYNQDINLQKEFLIDQIIIIYKLKNDENTRNTYRQKSIDELKKLISEKMTKPDLPEYDLPSNFKETSSGDDYYMDDSPSYFDESSYYDTSDISVSEISDSDYYI